mgnify:CR=1 FL=1
MLYLAMFETLNWVSDLSKHASYYYYEFFATPEKVYPWLVIPGIGPVCFITTSKCTRLSTEQFHNLADPILSQLSWCSQAKAEALQGTNIRD